MDFPTAFMETLKSRFVEVCGPQEFGGCESEAQKPYYLARIEDNLVMPMSERHRAEFGNGSGNELEGKMKAIRSSSAMTFNLLGNGPVSIKGDAHIPAGTYDVEFEHQLPTLVNNPNPANLDAKLSSVDGSTLVYCEMKLAEWVLNGASGLRPHYLDAQNYAIPEAHADKFICLLRMLGTGELKAGKITPALNRYDAFQMAKHLIAVYSECYRIAEAGASLPERVVLTNCVWEMVHPEKLGGYEETYLAREAEEHEQFNRFSEASAPIAELFAELGIGFALCYYSFAEFLRLLNLEERHRTLLDRYLV